MWTKVTYYHTWYKRNVSVNVRGKIEFIDGCVHFGTYLVEAKYMVSIEPIED